MNEYSPYILDAAIVLPMIVYMFVGMRKGFLYSVLSFASSFGCIFIARIYAPALCEVLFGDKSGTITEPIFTGISYVVMYVISRFIAKGLVKLFNIVTKVPVIKPINKVLGGFLGLIRGVILSAVIIALTIVIVKFSPESQFADSVSQTKLLSYISAEILALT